MRRQIVGWAEPFAKPNIHGFLHEAGLPPHQVRGQRQPTENQVVANADNEDYSAATRIGWLSPLPSSRASSKPTSQALICWARYFE